MDSIHYGGLWFDTTRVGWIHCASWADEIRCEILDTIHHGSQDFIIIYYVRTKVLSAGY